MERGNLSERTLDDEEAGSHVLVLGLDLLVDGVLVCEVVGILFVVEGDGGVDGPGSAAGGVLEDLDLSGVGGDDVRSTVLLAGLLEAVEGGDGVVLSGLVGDGEGEDASKSHFECGVGGTGDDGCLKSDELVSWNGLLLISRPPGSLVYIDRVVLLGGLIVMPPTPPFVKAVCCA